MTRDPDQPMMALALANERRLRRASLRRQCHNLGRLEGMAMIADMLEAEEPAIQSMFVADLLRWPPRVYLRRVEALMVLMGIRNMGIEVRRLSARQRGRLVEELRRGTLDWVSQVRKDAA